ncbi:pentapeptide repeat-containing protein [Roseibium sp. HPY-6]|uniref:pentapeptide repeat-containing protein n=1 Tax=Roseibium sp. HPY-6 TaxID=3229852 RepID=UPI00338D54E8
MSDENLITPNEARAKLNDLSVRIEAAKSTNDAKPSEPAALRYGSAKRGITSLWRNTMKSYRSFVSALDAVEKSPLVRLAVALVFLLTAATVLFDLNDRRTQIEIAAWDLFEKTKPGTPQRTRAANLLADTGASLVGINFGTEIDSNELVEKTKEEVIRDATNSIEDKFYVRSAVFKRACKQHEKGMSDVDFSHKLLWSTIPPEFRSHSIDLSEASFACLRITGTFEGAVLRRTNFEFTELTTANLSYSAIHQSSFEFTEILRGDFSGAHIWWVSFRFAHLGGWSDFVPAGYAEKTTFREATLKSVSFQDAIFSSVDFTDALFNEVNLSGAVFENASEVKGLTQEQLDETWAWEDMLPQGLDKFDPPLHVGRVCEIKYREPGTQFDTQLSEFVCLPSLETLTQ